MATGIEIILSLLVPFILLRFRKNRLISLIGTAGAAYLAGMLYALVSSILSAARSVSGTAVSEIVGYAGISLAIPLLLFSGSIRGFFALSGEVLRAFCLLIVSVLLVTAGLYLLWAKNLAQGAVLSGMAAALYTGGTPNLNAVACLFGLDPNVILAANLSDMVFGGIFYLFLLFGAKRVVCRVLPSVGEQGSVSAAAEKAQDRDFSLTGAAVRSLLLSAALAAVSALIGAAVWMKNGQPRFELTQYLVPALMIGTTAGGVALSFCDKVSSVAENEQMGQYFAAIFSFCLASAMDISRVRAVAGDIFLLFAAATTLVFAVHLLLCRLFRVHAETMIVTATAGIYGPAFIPNVCASAGAQQLMTAGLITGSFGYAIGTGVGVACTYLLRLL